MTKYLLIYHGGMPASTPAEGEKVMKAWMDWMGGLGKSMLDAGNPSSRARSNDRFATRRSETPRDFSVRAVRSLTSPAPVRATKEFSVQDAPLNAATRPTRSPGRRERPLASSNGGTY